MTMREKQILARAVVVSCAAVFRLVTQRCVTPTRAAVKETRATEIQKELKKIGGNLVFLRDN